MAVIKAVPGSKTNSQNKDGVYLDLLVSSNGNMESNRSENKIFEQKIYKNSNPFC